MDCLAYHRSIATADIYFNVSNCSLRALNSSKSTYLPSSMQTQPSKLPFIHLASHLGKTDDPGSPYDAFPALAMYSPFAIFRALRIESGSLLESSREKNLYFLFCPHSKTLLQRYFTLWLAFRASLFLQGISFVYSARKIVRDILHSLLALSHPVLHIV